MLLTLSEVRELLMSLSDAERATWLNLYVEEKRPLLKSWLTSDISHPELMANDSTLAKKIRQETPFKVCAILSDEITHSKDHLADASLILVESLLIRHSYKAANSILNSLEQHALTYDMFDILNRVYYYQSIIHGHVEEVPSLKAVFMARSNNFKNWANYLEYMGLLDRLNASISSHSLVMEGAELAFLKSLLKHPSLDSEERCRSNKARRMYNLIKGMSLANLKDYDQSCKHYRRFLELTLSDQYASLAEKRFTISSYHNYLSILLLDNEYELAESEIENFSGLPAYFSFNDDLIREVKLRTFSCRAQLNLKKGDYQATYDQLEEVTALLESPDMVAPTTNMIAYISVAVNLFFLSKYEETIHWLEKIQHAMSDSSSEDIHAFAYCLHGLICVEQEDYSTLSNLVNEAKSYIKNHRRKSRYEHLFLSMLEQLSKETEQLATYSDYLGYFESLGPEAQERGVTMFFDVSKWLRTKIEEYG